MKGDLAKVIEYKEIAEQDLSQTGEQPFTEMDVIEPIYPILVQILKERRLNTRALDERHKLRKQVMIIMHLFSGYIFGLFDEQRQLSFMKL